MTSSVLLDTEEKSSIYPHDQFFAILKQLQTTFGLYLLVQVKAFHGYFEGHMMTHLIFEIKNTLFL